MTRDALHYRPAWWVPGGHAQTLWGKLVRRTRPLPLTLERWMTPDDDFLEVHRIAAAPDTPANTPHVLLLHGLEGTIRSHYAQGLLGEMHARGWSADLLIWRSCGTEPNRARRFYHSGETSDLAFAIARILDEFPHSPLGLAGVSLGGNVLLKYLGENGAELPSQIRGAAAVSVPFDLGRGADHINHGFSRVYQKYFLDSLKDKALEKQSRYPDLVDPAAVSQFATLRDFDDALTAPIHGFTDAVDYYTRSSSIRFLDGIRTPTLLLNAMDDPFLPTDVLEDVRARARGNRHLTVEFPPRGGHAGFVSGWNPFRPVYYLERRVGQFLAATFAESDTAPINP